MTSDIHPGVHGSAADFTSVRPAAETISIRFVVLTFHEQRLKVLCRQYQPFVQEEIQWTLPGGPLHPGLSVDDSAQRHLRNLVGEGAVYCEQLKVFGIYDYLPLTIGYFALVPPEVFWPGAAADGAGAQWRDADEPLNFILDYQHIRLFALNRLRSRLTRESLAFHLMPKKFTLLQLQQIFEAILNVRYNKGNFRRKLGKMNFIVPCREKQQGVAHRAAELYTFDELAYQRFREQGFSFSL